MDDPEKVKPRPQGGNPDPFADLAIRRQTPQSDDPFADLAIGGDRAHSSPVPVLSPLAQSRRNAASAPPPPSPIDGLLTPAEGPAAAPVGGAPAPNRLHVPPSFAADALRQRPEANPQAQRLGTVARGLTMPLEMGAHLLENPIGGAAEFVTAPFHAAKTAAEYAGQKAAEISLPEDAQRLAEADPERVQGQDAAIAGAQLASMLVAPGASRVVGGLAGKVVGPAIGEAVGHVAAGGLAGAAWTPDDPLAGAIGGALMAAPMAGRPVARAVSEAGDVSAGVMEGAVRDLAADPHYQAEINPAAGVRRSKPFVPGSAEDVAMRRADALAAAESAQAFAPPAAAAAVPDPPTGPRHIDRRAAGRLRLVDTPEGTPAVPASPLVTDPTSPPTPSTIAEPPAPPPLALLGPDGQPIPREPVATPVPAKRLRRRGAATTERTPDATEAPQVPTREALPTATRRDTRGASDAPTVPAPEVEKIIQERDAARRAAETDPLTGLGNRAALDRALPAAEADAGTSVVTWDGNNFGKINKLVSQEAGDAALKDMAAAIRQAAEEHGVGERVFRRGGDEFVVLAPKDKAAAIRGRAEEIFGERTIGEGKKAVTISLSGTHGPTFNAADAELQAAKQARKAAHAAEAAKVPPEYLNYAKFGEADSPLGKSIDARIRERVDALRESGQADKGYQSFDTQREMASAYAKKMLGTTLDVDWTKADKLSGAEIVGLHEVVNENTAIMEGASRAIQSGTLEGEALATAHRAFDAAQHATDEALSRIVREKAQTARDLGFLRQVAQRTMDPDVWLVQAKKLLGDAPLPDGVALEIRRLAAEAKRLCGGGA